MLSQVDAKIIYELDLNSRIQQKQLGKKLKLSQQAINVRLRKLERLGIIRGYNIILNTHLLGFIHCRVYMLFKGLTPKEEEIFIKYLSDNEFVNWCGSLSARWDVEILILSRNLYEFNKTWSKIHLQLGDKLFDFEISIVLSKYSFNRRHIIGVDSQSSLKILKDEPDTIELNTKDKKLLNIISNNSNLSYVKLGKILKMTPNAVKYRLRNLEKANVIQGYKAWFDLSQVGYSLHKAMFKTRGFTSFDFNKLISFCQSIPETYEVIRCVGSWDLEIGFETKSYPQYRKIMHLLRNKFAEKYLNYESTIVYDQHLNRIIPKSL